MDREVGTPLLLGILLAGLVQFVLVPLWFLWMLACFVVASPVLLAFLALCAVREAIFRKEDR